MYCTQKYESPLSIGITSETIFSFFFFLPFFRLTNLVSGALLDIEIVD